jgi:hypothetical protein
VHARLSPCSSRVVALVTLTLVLVMSGCKVDATVDVKMREDGSGVVRVLVRADSEAVKAVEAGGVKIEQAVRLGDLASAGWDVGAWRRAKDGSAAVVLSKQFGAPEDVARIMAEISGDVGPLRGVRAAREAGLFATDYSVHGNVDLKDAKTGVPADKELVQNLAAQGVDVGTIDQQLLAQVASSFSLKVVVRLPGQEPITIDAKPAQVTVVDASSSVQDTTRVVLGIAAVGLGGLAIVVWFQSRRPRRRSRPPSTRPGRAAASRSRRRRSDPGADAR